MKKTIPTLIKVYPHSAKKTEKKKGKKTEEKKEITYYAVEIGEDNNSRKKIYVKITSNFDDMLFFLHQRGYAFYFERISGKVKGHMYFICPKSEEHKNPR